MRTARAKWKQEQPRLDASKIVFIDETGTSTNMTRLRGRCPLGKRLVAKVPHGHWKMTTFVAGLRHANRTVRENLRRGRPPSDQDGIDRQCRNQH